MMYQGDTTTIFEPYCVLMMVPESKKSNQAFKAMKLNLCLMPTLSHHGDAMAAGVR